MWLVQLLQSVEAALRALNFKRAKCLVGSLSLASVTQDSYLTS